MGTARKRIVFFANTLGFFVSHRLPIARACFSEGYDVHVVVGSVGAVDVETLLPLTIHVVPLSRNRKSLVFELHSLISVWLLFVRLRPDIVHLISAKPIIFGGIALRFVRRSLIVAAVSGLGTAFIGQGGGRLLLRRFVQFLYCAALRGRRIHVIFQNEDDRSILLRAGAVTLRSSSIVKGVGVSLGDFTVSREPEGIPVIVFAARLLRDKGAYEFFEAARILRNRGIVAEFWMAGEADRGNISSVSEEEVAGWRESGVVKILGFQADINQLFSLANLVVLPSYREGLPKVLIEAAACGRAIVTTDVPGCRDAIIPDETGILVPVRDVTALADAIQLLIMDPERRMGMGMAGRALAEREFDLEDVVAMHSRIYENLLRAESLL